MTAPRQLVVHAGTHKTGSTALQHHLRTVATSLAAEGIALVPRRAWAERMTAATVVEPELVDDGRRRLWEDLGSHEGTAVLSWEGFSGSPYVGYANAGAMASALREVTRGIPTRFVFFLRRQDYFAESMYVQTIKEGRSWTYPEFARAAGPDAFDWTELLDAYREQGGGQDVAALPYPDGIGVRGPWLPRAFGTYLGSQQLARAEGVPNAVNPRLTVLGVELLRRGNPRLDRDGRRLMRRMMEGFAEGHAALPWTMPGPERARLIERHAASNAALHDQWVREYREVAWTSTYPASPADLDERPDPPAYPTEVLDEVASLLVAAVHEASASRVSPTMPAAAPSRAAAIPGRLRARIRRVLGSWSRPRGAAGPG